MAHNTVTVVPLQSFQHGQLGARKGVPIKLGAALADDLKKAGLVTLQATPAPVEKGAAQAAAESTDVLPVKAPAPPEYRREVLDSRYSPPAPYYMRSGPGDGGRLLRLVDVVAWLIDACDVPRRVVVNAVCDAFEGREDAVFMIADGEYAKPISNADSFDGRSMFIGGGSERETREFTGLAGALNKMRENWPDGLDVLPFSAVGLDEVAAPYDLVCSLFVAPTESQQTSEPGIQTFAELAAYRKANKGAAWTDAQRAILVAEHQRPGVMLTKLAQALDTSHQNVKTQINKHLSGQQGKRERGKRQGNPANVTPLPPKAANARR